ncbi:uncharacterized protein CDAR_485811 [Caerostris darwini]|uniref:Uncharacterized protein n=1 Tax=Caerostris darwini TaxID=1538125 RepID=A0AAV4WLM8_9ARAC|nr:uncharacterized protein CDAR_485811 [Caerostris darwini]
MQIKLTIKHLDGNGIIHSPLREPVVPALQENHVLHVITLMQNGAPLHFAREIKAFLFDTFTEDRVINLDRNFKWPSRSPDLTPADFWLLCYL